MLWSLKLIVLVICGYDMRMCFLTYLNFSFLFGFMSEQSSDIEMGNKLLLRKEREKGCCCFIYLLLLCVCTCMCAGLHVACVCQYASVCVCVYVNATVWMWRSEYTFWESVLSFHVSELQGWNSCPQAWTASFISSWASWAISPWASWAISPWASWAISLAW